MKNNQRGFTLIELLVVIAIIALLSTLAVFSLNSARQKSRDAKRLADVKQVQTALELYYDDQRGYPVSDLLLGPTGDPPVAMCLLNSGFDFGGNCNNGDPVVYMGFVPGDPGNLQYRYVGTLDDYEIRFQLEGPTAGLPGETPLCASTSGLTICP
ncbi:MAG TPA: type II secretion system protein [Patescibacteria group bacterium]|nr:type II secretion system protein [Patescibacteria group bacterium]